MTKEAKKLQSRIAKRQAKPVKDAVASIIPADKAFEAMPTQKLKSCLSALGIICKRMDANGLKIVQRAGIMRKQDGADIAHLTPMIADFRRNITANPGDGLVMMIYIRDDGKLIVVP